MAIGVFSSFIASISSTLNMLRASRVENSKSPGRVSDRRSEKIQRRFLNVEGFPKMGVLLNGWFIVENLVKMDDLEVSPFQETSISMNIWKQKEHQ